MTTRRGLAALAGLTLGASASVSPAAMLYNWGVGPSSSVTDVAGDVGGGSVSQRDITKFWYARDAAAHYFRIDLVSAPTTNLGAGAYTIQIDDLAGGGTTAGSTYIAAGLSGIDQLVMSHFSPPTGAFVGHHRHDYQGAGQPVTTFDLATLGATVDTTENGGATLQWAVPFAQLNPGPFTFYAAAMNIDTPETYDVTTGITATAVPEPAALALTAVAGLGLLRRRRA